MTHLCTLFAGVHLKGKTIDFIQLYGIDFKKNVFHIKERIASRVQHPAANLELLYRGVSLADDLKIDGAIKPNAMVHCYPKIKEPEEYESTADPKAAAATAQKLFSIIAGVSINVSSRVNILQRLLIEYPEFRRNLAAQAMIRDSMLFNTLHQPAVIEKVAETYPIICEAAKFIVDTIKKEIRKNTKLPTLREHTNDSTNSSEEESTMGATNDGGMAVGASPLDDVPSTSRQSENARIRQISRQQLQAALAQIGFGSVNSLSNIAQRNAEEETPPTDAAAAGAARAPAASARGERISSGMLRSSLQQALHSISANAGAGTAAESAETFEAEMPPGDHPMAQVSPQHETQPNNGLPDYLKSHPYAEQLVTMAQMGFTNHAQNVDFLNMTNGNISDALNLLMAAMT